MHHYLIRACLCLLLFIPSFLRADTWQPYGPNADGRWKVSVWFADANTGWMVGVGGLIYRTTDRGATWKVQASGTDQQLDWVWGSDANNVWAVGTSGTILKWNGTAWTSQASGTTSMLNGVWGTDASNVWVAGQNGTLLKWNGTAWTPQASGVSLSLYFVWGTDASNVWVSGGNGTMLKWNGTAWSAQTSGTTKNLYGIWGSNPNDVWAVGSAGAVVRWNGTAWSAQDLGTTNSFNSVWGADANNVWAVGTLGMIMKWNGTAWASQPVGTDDTFTGVVGTDATHLWTVGTVGTVARGNGSTWTLQQNTVSAFYNGAWGADRSNVWAVAGSGLVRNWNGSVWTTQATGTNAQLNGIWGGDLNNVWSVGNSGTIIKWNGTAWSAQSSGTGSPLNGISGRDLTNVWAVGNSGTIVKWDGAAWTAQTSNTADSLIGVWCGDLNNVWAVGGTGTIVKWNGTAWSPQTSGTTNVLRGVWGSDANNVWAVGDAGAIVKWNGTAWSAQTSGTSNRLNAVWGSDANNVWAAGNAGTLLKWNGSAWNPENPGNTENYRAVWGTAANNVLIFGGSIIEGNATGPVLSTPTSAGLTTSGATLGGTVTSDGGAPLTEIGVVYSVTSVNGAPQIGGTGVTKVVASGAGPGAFTTAVGGLTANTAYSFAAYATNVVDTKYSSSGTFTTPKPLAGLALSNVSFTYDGTPKTATVTTTPAGVGLVVTYTAAPGGATNGSGLPVDAGTDTISVTVNDPTYAGSATGTLTIGKATPAITWAPPAGIAYGATLSGVQLNAAANTPGAFAYSPAAGTKPVAGAATLTVTFTPTDTVNYVSPVVATTTLNIGKAIPSLTWTPPAPITYGTALSGAQFNAVPSAPGTVTYSPPAGTVLSAGTHGLTATFVPSDTANYSSPVLVVVNLTVTKVSPTIAWTPPAAIDYGTALSGAQLNASASVAGTFVYSPASGTVLDAGPQVLTATFVPSDPVNHVSPGPISVSLTVNKTSPVITVPLPPAPTTKSGPVALPATDSAGLPLSYTVVSGPAVLNGTALTFTGRPGTIVLQARTAGDANNQARTSVVTFTVLAPNVLTNVSTRGTVGGGDAALITGFVISGSAPKPVLVRGIGPTLARFGVTNALPTLSMQVVDREGKPVASNGTWGGGAVLTGAFAQVGAFALDPASKDAALVVTLPPGAYTVVINGAGGASGTALAEVYDLSANSLLDDQHVANLSVRGQVSTAAGSSGLIVGFAITGSQPKAVLVRGVGPGLGAFGVGDALPAPQLNLFDAQGTLIARNVEWGTPVTVNGSSFTPASSATITTASAGAGAFALASGGKDSAVLLTLPPGTYSAQVISTNGVAGSTLVEIYEIP